MSSIRVDSASASVHAPTDVVVPAAKTRRPRRRIGAIGRDRLVELWAASDHDVALVLAPPGFGKTTLVSQLADATAAPVAWATVEPTDADPAVLLSTLLTALGRAEVDVAWPAGVLTADEPAFSRRVLPQFRSSLERLDAPVVLVVDDVHAMANPATAAVLAAAVDSLPDGSRVVLAGRARPDLPIARWRSAGRVLEVGAEELRFGTVETRACLTDVLGRRPTPGELAGVESSSQGWPVAVYLEGAALARTGITGHAPSQGLEDYLRSEVLGGLASDLADFLSRSSVLASLSGPACDHVLDRRESAEELRRIEAATLLVNRLDGPGGWYRVHPLLREALVARLAEERPEEVRSLHARAARWFADHGESEEALWHATECGDPGLVAEVGWHYAADTLVLGRTSTVRGWLDKLDPRDVESTPGLAVLATWAGIASGDGPAAQRWIVAAERALEPGWREDLTRSPHAPALAILVCVSGVLPYDEAAALTGRAADALPVTDRVRALALMHHGWNLVLAGEVADGRAALGDALALSRATGVATAATQIPAVLGYVAASQGDLDAARAHVEVAVAAWADLGMQDSAPSTGLVFGLDAYVHVGRRTAERTRADLARCARFTDELARALPAPAALVLAFAARALAALGDHAAAVEALGRAVEVAGAAEPSPWLSEVIAASRAELERLGPVAELSEAQRRVLVELGTDKTMGEIAADLHISINTVKSHARDIYRKLGITTRREARRVQSGA